MKKILLFAFSFLFLCSAAQTGIWGVTSAGGHYSGGGIFKTDGSGNNYSLKKSLFRYDGEYPKARLLQASNGKFYGMTSSCCVFDANGVFFEYDPVTKEYDKIFDFNDTINGGTPNGGLIQGKDGKLYGMTSKGGIHDYGVIFQYDPVNSVFNKKYDFDDANGSGPQGDFIEASDGKFYGLANTGGTSDYGALFQFDPITSTYVKKFDFDGEANGGNPLGSLIQAQNGKLYGLCSSGGKNNFGVLFEYDPSSSGYTKKIDFDGTNTGGHPYGSLLEAGDGNLYGLTTSGGSNDFGVLFQYNPSSSLLETKINFNSTGNGANPQSSLMLANNGLLYGTTEYGGTADEGIIFEYDPQTSVCTKKHEFNNEKDQNGQYPLGELMQASDGMLYGMSYTGGIAGVGVLFKYDPSTATYSKEFDFHAAPEGNIPTSSLLLASDKMFYGVAQSGGRTNDGAIYQYDPVFDSYVKKFDFDKNSSGSFPTGALMQASDGKIYGTTTQGGTNDLGVLFQFDPVTSAYTVKVTFDQVNGSSPYGELLQANDGKIYGMTREGGTHGNGVLFQFDPLNSNYTKKFDFDDVNGKYPEGGLMQAGDGKLYGVTTAGGSNTTPDLADGLGVLFQFDPATSIYTKKIDFDGTNNGSNPNGTLVTGPDGKLYGMTTYGGLIDADHPLGSGTLFQYDPASSGIEGKINFNGTQNGSKPNGSLLLASDGNFYGVTFAGGIFNMGILFQLDPMTFSFHKKVDFKKSIGKLCDHGKLTEITTVNSVADHSIATLHLNTYPNPAKDQVTLSIDKPIYNATVSIYTTSGQLVVKKTNVNGNRFILPISDLAKGTYFIEVTENENHSGIKLVKE